MKNLFFKNKRCLLLNSVIITGLIGVMIFIAIRQPLLIKVKSWFNPELKRQIQSDMSYEKDPNGKFELIGPSEYGENNPKSNGIFVTFPHFPLTKKQEQILLKITTIHALKAMRPLPVFKGWDFLWYKWYPEEKSQKVCDKVKKLKFVKDCVINGVLPISGFSAK